MNRQAMREKVLGEMVVARDLEIERLNASLAEVKQLNRHQGEKILELLALKEALSHTSVGMIDGRAVSVERVRVCGCQGRHVCQ